MPITKIANRVTAKVTIDNKSGWGAVPYNADIDYFGLQVLMKPSVFLSLALPLDGEKDKVQLIVDHIKSGGTIGAPFLDVTVPEAWEEGNFEGVAKITGHEGRHRMLAAIEIQGDVPIETHILVKHLRARHITRDIIECMQDGMCAEKSTKVITPKGQPELFKVAR
jgi:hypothetical protein